MTRPALFYALAAIVPVVTLWLAASQDRSPHGMAVSPFGWPSLLVVQCVAAVPLAAVIAAWVVNRVKVGSHTPPVIVGLLLAAGGYFGCEMIGDTLNSFPADFASRCVARSLLGLLLALPWAVAARAGTAPSVGSWARLAVGLAVGFVLPGVWAEKLAKENSDAILEELSARRITRAVRLVDGQCDLDPFRTERINGPKHLVEFRRSLVAEQKAMAERIDAENVTALHPNDWLTHATTLLQLDRPAEAEPILRELAKTRPPANLPLARALHLLGRYDESDAAVRELLTAGLPELGPDARHDRTSHARKACLDGFDLMVENATKRGSNADREAVLRDGLAKVPGAEAYFHFQLGRHFKLTGRPVEAMKELDEAMKADKVFEPSANAILRDIRENTPGCLVGR